MRSLCLILPMLLLFSREGQGLECYACNNESSGGACEFDAASTGITSVCSDIYDHCYTRRVEEAGRNSAEITRGCCRIETGSPVCPPGSEYQVQTVNDYTYYYTRCTGDFCNDTDGLNDGQDESGGNLIVEGVPEDYDFFDKDGEEEDGSSSGSATAACSALTLASLLSVQMCY